MAVSRKRQRAEAVESLRALVEAGLSPEVLEGFERGVVSCSQRGASDGDALVAPRCKKQQLAIFFGNVETVLTA